MLKADDDRTNHAVLLSGWLPIFDTMHGVRGEVNVQVKVELFSDLNKFRTSSCGVKFYIGKHRIPFFCSKRGAFTDIHKSFFDITNIFIIFEFSRIEYILIILYIFYI